MQFKPNTLGDIQTTAVAFYISYYYDIMLQDNPLGSCCGNSNIIRSHRLPQLSRTVEQHMVQNQRTVVRDAGACQASVSECVCVHGQAEVTLMPLKPALLMWACVQQADIQ